MKELQTEALDSLRNILEKAGHLVYTKLNNVSKSGMTRSISLYVSTEAGRIDDITWYVCQAFGKKRDRYDGIKVEGCGMDMGFHIVYNLSCKLYCPQEYNHDAAYKLQHAWL